jgi:hypothetical protein
MTTGRINQIAIVLSMRFLFVVGVSKYTKNENFINEFTKVKRGTISELKKKSL